MAKSKLCSRLGQRPWRGASSTGGGGREGDGGGWKEESKVALLRHIDGHQVHEKVLNITNHQGSANQNHSEVLPPT